MFALKSNSLKLAPKYVLLVTTLVLFSACATKEAKNASLEPLDLPADQVANANPTPEPEVTAPVKIKKAKKHGKAQAHKSKKTAAHKAKKEIKPLAAIAQVKPAENLPSIGDATVATAPLTMPPMAPPVPFDMGVELDHQPHWLLAAFAIAGIVILLGIALRVRKQKQGKRRLVYNA
jgi:hypothetical protein